MKFKIKQQVYVKETVTDRFGSQDIFIPCRVECASRDPRYVFLRSHGQYFIFEHGKFMVEEDTSKPRGFRKVKVPASLVFTKEEIDLLYG